MFAKIATTLAVGRRGARRSAAFPDHRNDVRPIAAAARGRPALVCQWRLDPASGRPVCAWRAEGAGAPAALDAMQRPRAVLASAAPRGEPSPRDATASTQAKPRPAAAHLLQSDGGLP